jgi:hypothetical protein
LASAQVVPFPEQMHHPEIQWVQAYQAVFGHVDSKQRNFARIQGHMFIITKAASVLPDQKEAIGFDTDQPSQNFCRSSIII